MIHKLAHILHLNFTRYELWWIQIGNIRKMMSGDRCVKCGKMKRIKPAGIEVEYETYP